MNPTVAFSVVQQYHTDHGGTVRAVHTRPVIGLSAGFALLAVLARTAGLSAVGWAVGIVCVVIMNAILA
ncbi:MAG: hypothetical protein QOF95_2749, partial [Pseudonocardiales bacterium]|nr:hypothetical protein [Pseudonocardiales bacterium]